MSEGSKSTDGGPTEAADGSESGASRLTHAELAQPAKASEDVARVMESLRGPAQQLLRSLDLHRAIVDDVGLHNVLLDNIAQAANVSGALGQSIDLRNWVADAARLTLPDMNVLGASMERMQQIISESANTASLLKGIAARPIEGATAPLHEPLLPLEVEATISVERGVNELARIGAGTAESIGRLAEVATHTLQQTLTLIAVMQQLHHTTKAGIESDKRTAGALINAVDSLEGTTDQGLSGTRMAVQDLVDAVQTLRGTTQAGIDSNADATAILLRWTRWLFVLTVTLVVFTAALLYLTWRLLPAQ